MTAICIGRVPSFFVVGHPKCGTTALFEMLAEHPRIFMPWLKEPQFFTRDLPLQHSVPFLPRTVEDYVSLFSEARPSQLIGEASTWYLASTTAARDIANLCPDAKIVAILREPASFIRSLHLQAIQNGDESEQDLRTALELERDRIRGVSVPVAAKRPATLYYQQHVRYTEQLKRYYAAFPPENILVLIYEEFRQDNERTISRVTSFLGLDQSFVFKRREANPTVIVKARWLDSLVMSLAKGQTSITRPIKGMVTGITPTQARRQFMHTFRQLFVFSDPPAVDDALMNELRRRFKAEAELVGRFLGRDLTDIWEIPRD